MRSSFTGGKGGKSSSSSYSPLSSSSPSLAAATMNSVKKVKVGGNPRDLTDCKYGHRHGNSSSSSASAGGLGIEAFFRGAELVASFVDDVWPEFVVQVS
jgi:hypothetical protein